MSDLLKSFSTIKIDFYNLSQAEAEITPTKHSEYTQNAPLMSDKLNSLDLLY